MTDHQSLTRAIVALTDVHGPCDVLVAAAGRAEPGYFLELQADTFRDQMRLNYFGTLHAVRAVLPDMLTRGRGHIVLVSSVAGLLGAFGYGAYTPTKFAVRGLGEALHAEFRHEGIVTSIVYPRDTDTPGLERENLTKPGDATALRGHRPGSCGEGGRRDRPWDRTQPPARHRRLADPNHRSTG